jgi:GNAT superfamily N-acetyltransferase
MTDYVLRRARLGDAEAVAALSAHIWEGEDYVPRRFEDWLAQDSGQFTVLYDGERLAGFGKLTRLAEGEWWLEGLRVHPEYRRRGVARMLHQYAIALADEEATGVLRFATSGRNVAVHKLAAESGFYRRSVHAIAGATAVSGKTVFRQLRAKELPRLQVWLSQSVYPRKLGSLFETRWKWLDLDPRLSTLVDEGRCLVWCEEGESIAAFVIVTAGEEDTLWLNYLSAPNHFMPVLAHELRKLTAEYGASKISGKPIGYAFLLLGLVEAGWEIEDEFTMWVFERPLQKSVIRNGGEDGGE